MVSASNTAVALTRRRPGAADDLERLYPTGVRNYVRVIAADDFQVAAGAMLAQRLGIRRPLVFYDNESSRANAEVFIGAAGNPDFRSCHR